MAWVETSQALRWSDSGTLWHHLAPVSNGLDTSIPLLHHTSVVLPSLMPFLSLVFSSTHITQIENRTGQSEKAGDERRAERIE